jgi:steroid 5-alpha reductase family enzyme
MLCCGMNGNCVPYADGLGYNGYRLCPSQVEIIKGDSNYLGITAIITVGMNLVSFFFAYKFQFDFLTDLTGSANFIVNALLPFLANKGFCDRQVMAVVLLCCSKAYLATYLFARVLKRGHDARFDEMRSKFGSFLGFWIFQMIWAWCCTFPVMWVASSASQPPLQATDWAGLALFLYGLICEVWGDLSKDAFRNVKENRNQVLCSGIWSWSRHPNFFGEIAMMWGLLLIAVAVVYDPATGRYTGWASLIAPLFTMLIMLFASGMPTAEGPNQSRYLRDPVVKAKYLAYRETTSPLIPMPPQLYGALPHIIKRIFFFEFDMYAMDWNAVLIEEPKSAVPR